MSAGGGGGLEEVVAVGGGDLSSRVSECSTSPTMRACLRWSGAGRRCCCGGGEGVAGWCYFKRSVMIHRESVLSIALSRADILVVAGGAVISLC